MQKTEHNLSNRSLLLVGILLLFTPIAFILIFPGAYEGAQFYLRLSASLGGAMIGAFIPGTLHIDTSFARATGALGIFVLTFTTDPSWAVYGNIESRINQNKLEQSPKTDLAVDGNSALHTQGLHLTDDKKVGMASCIAEKVSQFEQPKTKSVEGGARAPGPEFSDKAKTSQEDVCISVGPNQVIVDGNTSELKCFGDRCSVSEVRISDDQRKACVTTKAWSESKYFGGGGVGKYRLTVNYKNKVNDDDLHRFQQECLPNT